MSHHKIEGKEEDRIEEKRARGSFDVNLHSPFLHHKDWRQAMTQTSYNPQ